MCTCVRVESDRVMELFGGGAGREGAKEIKSEVEEGKVEEGKVEEAALRQGSVKLQAARKSV